MSGVCPFVPALNEQANVRRAVESARFTTTSTTSTTSTTTATTHDVPPPPEVIVVDGGSDDDTVGEARRAGAIVIPSPRGRANQCNVGAKHAKGDVLIFLHADSTLPPSYDVHLRRLFAPPPPPSGIVHGPTGVHSTQGASIHTTTITRLQLVCFTPSTTNKKPPRVSLGQALSWSRKRVCRVCIDGPDSTPTDHITRRRRLHHLPIVSFPQPLAADVFDRCTRRVLRAYLSRAPPTLIERMNE